MRTALIDLLGLDVPIVQASLGPWTSVELTVAACEAGALGSIGTSLVAPARLRAMLAELRGGTDRPFAVNHTRRPFSEDAFAVGLEAQRPSSRSPSASPATCPRACTTPARSSWPRCTPSSRHGAPSNRAPTSSSPRAARPGGFCGEVATMALVPQVVDAVAPFPPVGPGGYVTAPRTLPTPFTASGPPAEGADELVAAVRAGARTSSCRSPSRPSGSSTPW
jgi:nitronate monooxygenase/enoyl-[acyl-carrier protein] reductase II